MKLFHLGLTLCIRTPEHQDSTNCLKQSKCSNYRLSCVRCIVENAFGILAQRFHIFNRRIPLKPKNVDKVDKACCILHNYLMENKDIPPIYNRLNPDQEPYLQEDEAILAFEHFHGYRSADEVRALRNLFKTYFQRPEGAVTWQNRSIGLRD